jgi:hypothetical protein
MPKRISIAVALLILSAIFGYGQVPAVRSASIDGSIVLPTNQPMERFEVMLLAKDGEQRIASTYTGLSGRYHFGNIPVGSVDVVVRIDGFEEERVPVVLSSNTTTIVNMILTPRTISAISSIPTDSGVVDISEITRKYPRKAVDDYQKAAESKRKGDTARTQELLEGVVKLAPNFYDAHIMLGTVYQSMDRYRDAEKQYNLSRDLNPKSVMPLLNLSRLYLQEAEANKEEGPFVTGVMFDDSLHVLQDAVRLEPRNATVRYLVGVTFYRAHSYRIAEESFKEALNIDEHMGAARQALTNVYIRQRKWKEALDQIDEYLADNPKSADRSQMEAVRAKVIQQL